MRNMLAYLFAEALLFSGIAKKSMNKFQNSNKILSIYSHNPSKELFENIISWLKSRNVNFISTEDMLAFYKEHKKLPHSPVVITIDDGWKGNVTNVIEVAKQHRIPVTIFVTTSPVLDRKPFWWIFNNELVYKGLGKLKNNHLKQYSNFEKLAYLNQFGFDNAISGDAMSISDIKEADASEHISIESHTVSHPILTRCTDEKSELEISLSKQQMERVLGRRIKGFAYPNGAFGNREIAFLKKHGYGYAFTTESAYLNMDLHQNVYRLPRIEVLENASLAENICRISGAWFKRKKQLS